jgi:O-methyltransferase involved in polyketide biosynthesis
MVREKIHLIREKQTLLATLYARALESRSQHPILVDRWAEVLVNRIDYDFPKLGIGRNDAAAIAIRARQLDEWTTEFLAQHREALVLHLGCGLDARMHRIDPTSGVLWYDLDYPDVIELRQRLLAPRVGCMMIGSSVTDSGMVE